MASLCILYIYTVYIYIKFVLNNHIPLLSQVKSGSIGILLMTLLFGSGNFLMERGFVAGHTNVTAQCSMPKPCNVNGFPDWYEVGSVCVKYFNKPLNFTDAEFSCRTKATDAHLVSVHNKKHNDYLLCIVKKFNPSNHFSLTTYFVFLFFFFKISFSFSQSGKIFWLDGSYWDFQIWTRGEPNHMYTSTEECVEMNWKEIGKWNYHSCHIKKNYICAFKLNAILKPGSEEME
uniref:C-type lectin domain-containing protein n=1 Tax=Sinocyclocheilus anshuiensis TaxID=1608454 RepID=A0A671KJG0_9TELE